ncbi:methylase involved in ubiquinone/menaquinone biosynthesis [Xenococcus sp. PCC 7305]|uniref:class I SAM-dependent methyltransferase n=1 Tax=Xenococcus sp. PCC 7305 TaxID=102125 RepID=UPI0002ACAE6E|nr:class I SAM-dependent methyltransferase [Xenococcus sp. PCC 7305]ELS05436.1 methylase involved in ubiquinone/menaquinone biosynthesis [Xenococcus sp. PCC 7305]
MHTSQKLPHLSYLKAKSFDEYQRLRSVSRELYILMQDIEQAILYNHQDQDHVELNGYCHVCDSFSHFKIDCSRGRNVNDLKIPNWREGLACVKCRLNNRKRGSLHIFFRECSPSQESKIYLTEQKSPLYKHVAQKFPLTCGSEYLGEKIAYGTMTKDGIRNESLTGLSFENNKFDYILSFDVLEHIPNYIQAFKECLRVLKPKGKLVFSVPFNINSPSNIIRAKVDHEGNIIHLKPAQYHGDPMSKDGVLCFQDFGWQMLDEIREVGFSCVEAIIYRSRFYGYLGNSHTVFVAQK